MSAEQTLYEMLSADTSLAGLIDGRIYPDVIPQAAVLPALVYDRVATEPITTIHGPNVGAFITLQIRIWATTRVAAEQVADTVVVVLKAHDEPYTARGADFDEDTGCFGSTVDVTLFEVE